MKVIYVLGQKVEDIIIVHDVTNNYADNLNKLLDCHDIEPSSFSPRYFVLNHQQLAAPCLQLNYYAMAFGVNVVTLGDEQPIAEEYKLIHRHTLEQGHMGEYNLRNSFLI